MPTNLTRKRRLDKPTKPHPEFPLYAHPNGQWAKKIRGTPYYFGVWADPDQALAYYLEIKDDLLAGRKPRPKLGYSLRDLCNQFLTAKYRLHDNGELTSRTFADYRRTTDRIIAFFGKTRSLVDLGPEDFGQLRTHLSKKLGLVALRNEIGRIRVLFNFAFDNSLIETPIRYGSHFNPPSKRSLRQERRTKGCRMFEAEEIRTLLALADRNLKAMILLAVNCGLGNNDCALLSREHLDLRAAWLDFPRPKTGVERQCPLWPETVEALREVIGHASRSREETHLVFITKYGHPWVRSTKSKKADGKITNIDAVGQQFGKLVKQSGLAEGRNFYALRHTFETIAGETRDQVVVNEIMGHVQNDMASIYRERISQERYHRVTEYVRNWLLTSVEQASTPRNIIAKK